MKSLLEGADYSKLYESIEAQIVNRQIGYFCDCEFGL